MSTQIARPKTRAQAQESRGRRGLDATNALSRATFDLESAAETVLANWSERQAETAGGPEIASELAALCTAIQAAVSGDEWGFEVPPVTPLRRRLLHDLRSSLIYSWAGNGSAAETSTKIRLLAAIEQVEGVLAEVDEFDLSESLSGPDGLELVSEMAHDLRSPLTSILTLAEALRREQSGPVNELQRRQLGLIYSAALALSATASDVMELAHNGHLLAEERAPFAVSELFESVRNIVLPMAEEKGLALELKPPSMDRRIGHAVALSRILLNLTTNSLKFTQEGQVELAARRRGPVRMEFSVRDTGPGISSEALARLYAPFRHEPSRGGYCFSGTGLGLMICRKLVAAMGSELQIETSPEWGTRFYFEVDLPPTSHLL